MSEKKPIKIWSTPRGDESPNSFYGKWMNQEGGVKGEQDGATYLRSVFLNGIKPVMPPRALAYLRWSAIYNITWRQRIWWKVYDLQDWLCALHERWCYE